MVHTMEILILLVILGWLFPDAWEKYRPENQDEYDVLIG